MNVRCFLCLVVLVLTGCGQSKKEQPSMSEEFDRELAKVSQQVKDADVLWDSGDKEMAIEAYTAIINDQWGFDYLDTEGSGDSPRVFSRVIDHRISNVGLDAARDDIKLALRRNVSLSLSTPEANEFVATLREERRHHSTTTGKSQDGGTVPSPNSPVVKISLIGELRIGMTKDEVIGILGSPHKVKQTDLPEIPALNMAARKQEAWTYNPKSDSWIVLVFMNGVLNEGESGGYNIRTGLKIPKKLQR